MRDQVAVLACDDRGTINPISGSNTYALGGFASVLDQHSLLLASWSSVKQSLCGSSGVELKWSHFFPGHHQHGKSNPLISKDPSKWRTQALWALREIFGKSNAFPITTIVRKGNLYSSVLTKTPKGKEVIDIALVFAALLGQFALYLKQNNLSDGEVWFDNLGSTVEQVRFQESMTAFFNSLDGSAILKNNIALSKRISPDINFLDSSTSGIIQIADFVSGVIWAAAEGDIWFLSRLLEEYAPGGRRTYGIVIIEK